MDVVDWDRRYREGFYNGVVNPHHLLRSFWGTIPRGRVVDIAMGSGRNSLFLAGKRYVVCGLDRSWEALMKARDNSIREGRPIALIFGDAGHLPLKKGSMAGVIVFYFLLREIMHDLAGLLRQGGIIIYETFLKRQNAIDRHRNPDFLLDDGELLSHFKDFEVLFYEETLTAQEGKKRAIARFVGRKR